MPELPKSFWGDTVPPLESDPAPPLPLLGVSAPASFNEEAEWIPSFELLGHSFHESMSRLLNTDSAIMGKTLRTIEDVYNHLRNEGAGITATTSLPPDEPTVQKPSRPVVDPAEKIAKQQRVYAANKEWRDAIQGKKDAMRQWDDYVMSKHKAFQDARNS